MTGECGGKDPFIPSSNQCAVLIHLNALNHAPNVDWLTVSISYAEVLFSFGLDPFHKIFMG